MIKSGKVNVSELIDGNPLSGFQIGAILVCGVIAILDGFDIQVVSFVAPVLSSLWKTSAAAMGSVFSAGLFGLMIGALLSGPVADKIGRKWVVVASILLYGLFSVLTTLSAGVGQLVFFRFLTGLGLGGSMPNIIALTAEYAPEKVRKTMISVMFIGLPFGAVVGGILAQSMLPALGWKSLFYMGGVLPLVIGILAMALLPESIRFMVMKNERSDKVAKILRKIDRSGSVNEGSSFYLPEVKLEGVPVKHLVGRRYVANTVFLWIVFFMNLLIIYFVTNWVVTVLHSAGLPLSQAILGIVTLEGGGVVGGLVIGSWGDRGNIKALLGWAFFLGAVSLVFVGRMGTVGGTMTVLFLVGLFVVGAQFGINALAASVYPTSVRSTGIGWALGIGRIGSIIGPMIGSMLISAHMHLGGIFTVAAVPALLAAIAMVFIKMNPQAEEARLPESTEVVS
ncbi:MFS transporter [Alicyclobacillus curvatus]|nr:MFS transporter [Alicyclobacillus curvatus]